MVRLRSIDVVSCAKVNGVIHMAIGVLFGLFFMLIGMFGIAAAPEQQKLGMIGVLIFAALAPFVYGAIGFVIGAIGAMLYNWIAAGVGGIRLELEAVPVSYTAPATLPPSTGAVV